MILRVEIVRRPSGDYVATLTSAGGYVEDVGPFNDLWEACSVVGGIDDYRTETMHDTPAARRRRGDTEPITFDAAAAAAERMERLK